MPNTGFLGWAYISGSTISFDSGVADKQVLFMSGSSVISGASNFQFDYDTSTLSGTHIVPVATDTYDIALAASGVDIVDNMFDGDPPDPRAQQKLNFENSH